MSRISESEIADVIIDILEDVATRQSSIADLISAIPGRIALCADDLAPSPSRPGEHVWEQQVRNVTSHKNSPGNAVHDGRLVAIPGGLSLP